MSFHILLRNLIVVVVFGISATFAYAQDADDDGPPIVCNSCVTATDAASAALHVGLGSSALVVNNNTGSTWIVNRSLNNVIHVQQLSGPGIGTVAIGFPGPMGGFDAMTDSFLDAPGEWTYWDCVTPWSMYCW